GGRDLAGFQAQHHALDFLGNDFLGLFGDVTAALNVGLDHAIQVVDIVEEHALQFVHTRLDIARDGDVDQEHGTVAAPVDHGAHLFAVDDVVRRAAGSDDNIHV